MKNSCLKISYYLNTIIVILVIFALITMFGKLDFMNMPNPVDEVHWYGMLKYFTTLSNIFAGITSFLLLIQEKKLLNDNRKKIDSKYYILKMISTVSVTITFLTVFLYLGPGSEGGLISMLTNSNLFFHCIVPVLAIISFALFERTNKIDKNYIKYGVLPVLIYGIVYVLNVVLHIENNKVSTKYDWYWFFQRSIWLVFLVVPLMLIASYFVSYILYRINYKKEK